MGDLANLIVAKGFKKLPKLRKIAESGHTASMKPDDSTQVKKVRLNFDENVTFMR